MELQDIARINAQTLADIDAHRADHLHPVNFRFYGYYKVGIFECPPFLMYTNNDCPRAENILAMGSYEPTSMRIWCRLARSATIILDVGAHVGVYGLAAASLRSNVPIHCFEPNPRAYARLSMHKHLNGFGNLFVHAFAVGHVEGNVVLSWFEKPSGLINSGASVVKHKKNFKGSLEKSSLNVPLRPLNGLPLANEIGKQGLIKIDVEGAEFVTFSGMTSVLEWRPDIILETFDPISSAKIHAMIKPLGYKVFHIKEAQGVIVPCDELKPADKKSNDLNHLLTTKSASEINDLLS